MKIKNFIVIAVAVIMLPIMMFAAGKGKMVPMLNNCNQLVGWKQVMSDGNGKTVYSFYSADKKTLLRRVTATEIKSGGVVTHLKLVTEQVKDGALQVVGSRIVPFNAAQFKVAQEKAAKQDAVAIAKFNGMKDNSAGKGGLNVGGANGSAALANLDGALGGSDTQNGLPESSGYAVQ